MEVLIKKKKIVKTERKEKLRLNEKYGGENNTRIHCLLTATSQTSTVREKRLPTEYKCTEHFRSR